MGRKADIACRVPVEMHPLTAEERTQLKDMNAVPVRGGGPSRTLKDGLIEKGRSSGGKQCGKRRLAHS